ncbi:tRNA (guanosine(46)-N7)-methyltransferase TrmB [Pseudohongiella spirulinae]|uniref:tRNA (guanine-N(7)-)-methyltransferase n=1 Tax=Pseudohongiella spirulinae TaxID=1249552 RepID=A0A0S2KH13_9GAMM|nr:tRNA (guanosine(46)-N7)-methyltransferase TrmB [Pseudohongiella spirulinae]ALO47592.1 tRNA (guanine-N(7)-)-methyltransferase [Pseudohongiella spirulinae]
MSDSPISIDQHTLSEEDQSSETKQLLTNTAHHRPLRSFVIRAGRLTTSQKEALDKYWVDYVIEQTKQLLDPEQVFGRKAPLVVEIGFGMGDSLAEMAMANPDKDYIGIEVHRPGVGKLLNTIAVNEITNLRIYCHDAVEILRDCIADHSLAGVQIFFPDPWHKKKHHKRRLIQPAFVEKLTAKLQPGGFIHLATDWQHYAEHMLEVMQANPALHNTAGADTWASHTGRPETKFERRGHRLGHGVWDLVYTFNPPQP